MNRTLYSFLSIILLVFIYSCGTSKKISKNELHSLPSLPVSKIYIPVKVYMRPLLAAMDSTTSREFTSEKWPDYFQPSCDFRYKYRFVRSPFTFSCVNNKVNIAFRGFYQIAGSKTVCALDKQLSPWVSGSCGFGNEPLRRVDLNISSTLQFFPDYRIRTTTKVDKLNPLDKCEVTLLHTDLTGEIIDSIRASVESYCKTFDQFVQELNDHSMLQQWRKNGASKVMPVSEYGFLNLNPTAFQLSPFNYDRDTLKFMVGFEGNPKFSSDSNSLINRSALPPLRVQPGNSGISTYLDLAYQYSALNTLLNDSLYNKPFDVEGRTFVIKYVNVGGTNEGKISLSISFTGNRSGVLRLTGTPVLDSAKQVISMPDIDFALDTKDILVNMAKGLFRKKILKTLKDQSVFDIDALIQRNRAAIQARMNQRVNEWMSLSGTFRQFKIVGLLPQQDHIQIQVYLDAELSLIGNPSADKLLTGR
jgi:hypothetical protein